MRHTRAMAVMLGALLVASGCPEETEPDPEEFGWQVVFDDGELDRALLAVWGTSSKSVYAVGGPLGNAGFEALALHFDGKAWKELPAGGADSFWWVSGSSDADVWMVGEAGRITHYDGQSFTEHPRVTTATLWGAIAFSPTDAWAVGGMPGSGTPKDVVLRYDGNAWTPVALPEVTNAALFKVWGTSSEDLFVVGEAGTIWHKRGADWVRENQPAINGGNLTTVHGCAPNDVFAVGARDVLHFDGNAWSKLQVGLTNDVNGVHCAPAVVSLVGAGGLKQRRVDGAFIDEFAEAPHGDLHGTWVDENGAVFAVGGDFISGKKPNVARNGIVARYAKGKIADTL